MQRQRRFPWAMATPSGSKMAGERSRFGWPVSTPRRWRRLPTAGQASAPAAASGRFHGDVESPDQGSVWEDRRGGLHPERRQRRLDPGAAGQRLRLPPVPEAVRRMGLPRSGEAGRAGSARRLEVSRRQRAPLGFQGCPAGSTEPAGAKPSAPGEPDNHQWWANFREQFRTAAVLPECGVMGASSAATEGGAYVLGWQWKGLRGTEMIVSMRTADSLLFGLAADGHVRFRSCPMKAIHLRPCGFPSP